MKKEFTYILGLLTLLAGSCADEAIVNTSGELRITGGMSPDSRTVFVQEGNVTHTQWVQGDRIGLHTDKESNISYQALSNGASTEFSALSTKLEYEEGKKVYAYYPHTSLKTEDEVYLPYTLGQTTDQPAPVFLYSTASITGKELNLQFKHVFAYLRITVTASMFREYKELHSYRDELTLENSGIYIRSNEPISCNNALFNLKTQEIQHGSDPYRAVIYCQDIDMESENSYTYFIPVLPQSASQSIDISLFFYKKVEDGLLYLVPIENKQTPENGIQAGHVYNLNYGGDITVDEEQTAILQKLYQATGGDQWYNKANWLTDKPLNEWYGVNAGNANYNHVHSLDLSYNNLTGQLPAELGGLMDKLESLNLEGNLLGGDIPTAIKEHAKWSELGWGVIHQDFDNGGGFNLANSGLYAGNSTVTRLDNGTTASLHDIFAQNKLTQVIVTEPTAQNLVRNFDAAKVNHHLDYQTKGLGTIVFTNAEEGGENADLINTISKHYSKVNGMNWLYGYHPGIVGYSYLYDSQGQLVHIAPFRTDRDNTEVRQSLDKFLRSTLGEPAGHAAFKMTYYTSADYSKDGEVFIIQQATEGNGIDLVMIGEGFTDQHMAKGGAYEEKMWKATEKLFSIEPYASHRKRFNVYGVKVVSPNAEFTQDAVRAIDEEHGVALAYAALTGTNLPLTVVVYNTEEYVDRSYCQWYSGGACVAYIMDELDNTLLHEMGHGIAWLADEYEEPGQEEDTLPYDEIERLNTYSQYAWGAYMNVDYNKDPGTIRWAHLLGDSRFANEDLDIYEGGYYYGFGAYRSSENSMMRYNISWFNAPSREMIYKAVMYRSEGSDWEYDYEDFVKFDEAARKSGKAASRAALTEAEKRLIIERHRPPTFIPKNWRDEIRPDITVPFR